MDIWYIVGMLGGLSLFLYGMNSMGNGLELIAGGRMQGILEKLTTKRMMGIGVGIVITAVIQSSSATTVMVVGFVNSGLMNLTQAINVIMGANIGTTVTGQLIALNISSFAPLIAFVGLIFSMSKVVKRQYIGKIIIGLGFLFMGLNIMSESMAPLKDSPAFVGWMQGISNPLYGVAIGAIFTAIIQSSSASVGVLQALALQGLVPFHTALYIVLGQNIGTCITSVLASIGAKPVAKQAALSHVLFNTIGTLFFIAASFFLPIEEWIIHLSPDDPMRQIANLHTIFNLTTTVFLFPFSDYLASLSSAIIHIKPGDAYNERRLLYVQPGNFADHVVLFANLKSEILRMLSITRDTFADAVSSFDSFDDARAAKVFENVQTIHFLNKEMTKVNVELLSNHLGQQQSETLTDYLRILSNLDRCGDYTLHLTELARSGESRSISYSETAHKEIRAMNDIVMGLFQGIAEEVKSGDLVLRDVYSTKYQLDSTVETCRDQHLTRMREGHCGIEAGLNYDKFLSYLSRIAEHLVQVADAFSGA